ncbi:hypothetical protein CEXT_652781 [Caerostris extrusa]|uniref:Uncharacterized protein n=1 Tax=Caerostris extrusa TaxID=172846 RepID=A0AAV4M3R6_CAEEX|nr:hypothetical protein CEXT_652781 [Caerostris extrusa]
MFANIFISATWVANLSPPSPSKITEREPPSPNCKTPPPSLSSRLSLRRDAGSNLAMQLTPREDHPDDALHLLNGISCHR